MWPTFADTPLQGSEFKVFHDTLRLRTGSCLEFVDLTHWVEQIVRRSGVTDGIVTVTTRHTTTGVIINENEPLLLLDLAELLEQWAPEDRGYRHDQLERRRPAVPPDEPRNGHSHARAVLLGATETLQIEGGVVRLGRWQRIFFVELDGGRQRTLSMVVLGQARRANGALAALRQVPDGEAAGSARRPPTAEGN